MPRKTPGGPGRRRTPGPLGRVQGEPSRPPPAGPGPSSPRLLTARSTAEAVAEDGALCFAAVAAPEIIPIRREADYRTDTIGRYKGGQFLASVTGASRARPGHMREGDEP